jgi:hypothetical protein
VPDSWLVPLGAAKAAGAVHVLGHETRIADGNGVEIRGSFWNALNKPAGR